MNSKTRASDFPVCSLFGSGMEKPRVPGERHADTPAVEEIYHEVILCDFDVHDLRASFRFRSSHSMPAEAALREE